MFESIPVRSHKKGIPRRDFGKRIFLRAEDSCAEPFASSIQPIPGTSTTFVLSRIFRFQLIMVLVPIKYLNPVFYSSFSPPYPIPKSLVRTSFNLPINLFCICETTSAYCGLCARLLYCFESISISNSSMPAAASSSY